MGQNVPVGMGRQGDWHDNVSLADCWALEGLARAC
jgi:hypothetical protein